MKITVFGGSGFLGSHVCDKLSEAGYDVTVADLRPSPWIRPDQRMMIGDINDSDFVYDAVRGAEVVFNFAGIADLGDARLDIYKTAKINILGNINVLQACVAERVKRFVFASSMYVYGDHGGFYRCSKQANELFIEQFHKDFGLEFTILRYGSLYGKRSGEKNGIYSYLRNAIENGKIAYYGNSSAMREFINVEDAALSSCEILKPEYANANIVLTGSQLMRIADIFTMIGEILGKQLEIEYRNEKNHAHYSVTPYRYMQGTAKKMYPALTTDFGHGLIEVIEQINEELKNSPSGA